MLETNIMLLAAALAVSRPLCVCAVENKPNIVIIFALALALAPLASNGAAKPETASAAVNLRTDYRENPLGIDRLPPKLFWQMDAGGRRGAAQTAYHIQAASSPERLAAGNPDFWDSGLVDSPECAHIAYGGTLPSSGQRVWWRVKVRDEKGRESAWTQPAWLEAGLLEERDWRGAQWIGATPAPDGLRAVTDRFDGAAWITATGDPAATPRNKAVFSVPFDLPDDAYAVEARVTWVLDGPDFISGVGGVNGAGPLYAELQPGLASQADAAESIRPGANRAMVVIKAKGRKTFNPSDVRLRYALDIRLADGSVRKIRSDASWSLEADAKQSPRAPVAAAAPCAGEKVELFGRQPSAPVRLRTSIDLPGKIESARLYASGLGYFTGTLNDAKIGDHVLDPGVTDYETWALYQTFDATGLLKPGANEWAIHLGPGFYDYPDAFGTKNQFGYGQPGAKALLVVRLADGTEKFFTTGPDWQWQPSPVVRSDIYLGETFDARLDGKGDWKPAAVLPPRSPLLKAQDFAPIRVIEELAPVEIKQVAPKTWRVDFGRVIAGWPRLRCDEPAGTVLRMRLSEYGSPDGRFVGVPGSFWKVHADCQRHTVIAGGGPLDWRPEFTYGGFRYVEIHGLDATPTKETLTALVVHTDSGSAATFHSSIPLLDRIFEASMRTKHQNTHSLIQDCPTREKGQWGGDMLVATHTGLQLVGAPDICRQQVRTYLLGKLAAGGVPRELGTGLRNETLHDVNWGMGPLEAAWLLWKYHGDLDPIREHYPLFKHYIEWLDKNSPGQISDLVLYGDHATPMHVERVPAVKPLMATMGFYLGAKRLADMATALDKEDDARWADALAGRIREAMLAKWYDPKTHSFPNSTHQSLALDYGVIPEADRAAAGKALADIFRNNGHQFDAGIFGYRIYPALSEAGEGSTALRMLLNPDYPGIARSIVRDGATTIWERFIDDPESQLQRSFDHPALTAPAGWMISHLAGIRPDYRYPGFRRFLLAPDFPEGLDHVAATQHTLYGTITSAWKRDGNRITWTVTVPPNCSATVQWSDGREETLNAGTHRLAVEVPI